MRMQWRLVIRKPDFYYLLLIKAVLQKAAKSIIVAASGTSVFYI